MLQVLASVPRQAAEPPPVAGRLPPERTCHWVAFCVARDFGLELPDLFGPTRGAPRVAFARQVAMYVCRQRLKSSFPELGRAFGNRDHTTVMSAVRRVQTLRLTDPQVNAHLEAIEQKLASSEE